MNRASVAFLEDLGREYGDVELIVSGNIGPRGDGYNPEELTPEVAAVYHRAEIESFAAAGADRVTLLTGTHTGEPIGIVQAAVDVGIPVVIGFTVETDGRLPSGQPLHEAVAEVDAATGGAVLHNRVQTIPARVRCAVRGRRILRCEPSRRRLSSVTVGGHARSRRVRRQGR